MRATKVWMKYTAVNYKWKSKGGAEEEKRGGAWERDRESELANQRGMSSVLRRR